MDGWTKIKEWINENAPMLSGIYQNKYVAMAYDRFASLPAKQQKQVMNGIVLGVLAIVVGYLGLSYMDLWSISARAATSEEMTSMIEQYQKQRRDKGAQISDLERNNQLAGQGMFKQALITSGRSADISPRMMQVEEKPETGEESGHDVKIKQATVSLQRVTLRQLYNFLKNIEFGQYNLSVSSIKITNDSKIRGYMNVDMGVVAYLFQTEAGE